MAQALHPGKPLQTTRELAQWGRAWHGIRPLAADLIPDAVLSCTRGEAYLTTTVSVSLFVSPSVTSPRSSGVWTFDAVSR